MTALYTLTNLFSPQSLTKKKESLIEQQPSGIAKVTRFVTTSQVTANSVQLLAASDTVYVSTEIV